MCPAYREEPCRTALNRVEGMPFRWSLNPYTGCVHRCTFCYVRAYERRADRPDGEGYGRVVRVKINVADVLQAELRRRTWRRELVAVGTATDPYQPAEGRYRLTRRCLEALAAARTPFSLVTRGPLVVRDVDVLGTAAARVDVEVSFSIPTLDEVVWRRTEPGTASPRQRLRALATLASAGIRCGVGMAPILPGLSDGLDQLAAVVRAARDAGAAYLWASVVHLRPGTREHFLACLAREWPEALPRYERLFAHGAYADKAEVARVTGPLIALRREHGLAERGLDRPSPLAAPTQLDLALR